MLSSSVRPEKPIDIDRCDKTLYSKRPLNLGKYVILEKGHSAKEKSEYFGTYEEVKNMIEELAQQE